MSYTAEQRALDTLRMITRRFSTQEEQEAAFAAVALPRSCRSVASSPMSTVVRHLEKLAQAPK